MVRMIAQFGVVLKLNGRVYVCHVEVMVKSFSKFMFKIVRMNLYCNYWSYSYIIMLLTFIYKQHHFKA